MATQSIAVPTLVIADTIIHQDADGRYCINDLHQAAGNEPRHKPANWLRSDQTIELIEELSTSQIREVEQYQPVSVINGGNNQGTFVVKELVYAYAMWVSPKFHLQVIRAYDALVTNQFAITTQSQMDILARLKSIEEKLTRQVVRKISNRENKEEQILLLLNAIYDAFGHQLKSAQEIIILATLDIHEALVALCGHNLLINPRKLGYLLKPYTNTIIGDYELIAKMSHGNTYKYLVNKID